MITQTVTVKERDSENIIIGRRGTYQTEQIVFDVSYLVEAFGDGSAVLMVKRPPDDAAYPAYTERSGNNVIWTVSESDTYAKGHGEAELFWYVDGGLAKSVIYSISILRDIAETTTDPPEDFSNWIEQLTELGAETLENARAAADAEAGAEHAQEAAEADATLAESWAIGGTGTRSGEDTDNAKYYAEIAAQGAEESGYAWFNVHQDDGEMYVYISDNLFEDVHFSVKTSDGTLEVTYE